MTQFAGYDETKDSLIGGELEVVNQNPELSVSRVFESIMKAILFEGEFGMTMEELLDCWALLEVGKSSIEEIYGVMARACIQYQNSTDPDVQNMLDVFDQCLFEAGYIISIPGGRTGGR